MGCDQTAIWSHTVLTFVAVDLIQSVPRRQRFHISSEFFGESFNELVSRRVAANAQTLCGHVPSNMILEVEAHHTMKLRVLSGKR